MRLQDSHIKRLIDYLDTTYADTKKLRQQSITTDNYQPYYDNYKEIKTFISRLDTQDSELKKLFDTIPSLPRPDSLPLRINSLICSLLTSTTVFFTAFWGLLLFTLTAPISIPLFIYGQIRVKEIKNKLATIETTSAKLSFLLRTVSDDKDKVITSSQTH